MKIGVLALQGAFREHIQMLKQLGVETKEIRNKEDLEDIQGIILPGGESTAMGKLLVDLNIKDKLKNMIENGLPVLGTCAGMILLANKLSNDTTSHLALMNILVKRNAYGRQLGSFTTYENFKGIEDPVKMVFIRAPYIEKVGDNVDILATVNNNIVAARTNNILVISFHPELTEDTKVHKYFLEMCKASSLN